MNYEQKYLKYKKKYLSLKSQYGGVIQQPIALQQVPIQQPIALQQVPIQPPIAFQEVPPIPFAFQEGPPISKCKKSLSWKTRSDYSPLNKLKELKICKSSLPEKNIDMKTFGDLFGKKYGDMGRKRKDEKDPSIKFTDMKDIGIQAKKKM